jgi:Peroxidase
LEVAASAALATARTQYACFAATDMHVRYHYNCVNAANLLLQQTTTGGPDSSVVFEMDREENKGLGAALDACKAILSNMKRTSEISLSDIIAFGGGEAIEACGGPRIVVQLGRYDEKKAANPAEHIPGYRCRDSTHIIYYLQVNVYICI